VQHALLLVYLAALGLDASVTERRAQEFGLDVELNPAVRWLMGRLGIRAGILVGIFVPSLALAYVAWPWPLAFGVVVGFRLCFATLQLLSFRP